MAGSITSDRLPTAGKRRGGPLIVTEDAALLDDLLRLCAAAGAEPEVHHGVPEHKGGWEGAPLILVGDDAAARVRGGTRRPGVYLVGRDQDDPDVWQRAVEIGAEYVLRLPDAESWLVERIADVAEGAGDQALTVGVIGGRGGAGASTLACALAVTAARSGQRTVLIDGDPLGGGSMCCSEASTRRADGGRISPVPRDGWPAGRWRNPCRSCTGSVSSAGTGRTPW